MSASSPSPSASGNCTGEDAGNDSAVNQQVRTGDEGCLCADQELDGRGDVVWCADPAGRAPGDHRPHELAARAAQLEVAHGRGNDAWRNRIDPGPPTARRAPARTRGGLARLATM